MKTCGLLVALGMMATSATAEVAPVRLPPTRPEAAHRLTAPATTVSPVTAPAKGKAKAKAGAPAGKRGGKKHRTRKQQRRR